MHDLKIEAQAEEQLVRILPPQLRAQVKSKLIFAGHLDEWGKSTRCTYSVILIYASVQSSHIIKNSAA
jgi:hypothetical protein